MVARFRLPLVRSLLAGCFSILTPALWGNAFTISTTLPNDLQSASSVFSKYVEVFGLRVLATSSVSDAKVLHTASVLAEYLDNDENGLIDQAEVLTSLVGPSNATISTMVLFASQTEQDSFDSSLAKLETIMSRTQNLFADEIFENGSKGKTVMRPWRKSCIWLRTKDGTRHSPLFGARKREAASQTPWTTPGEAISKPSQLLILPMHGIPMTTKPLTMLRKSPNTSIGRPPPTWAVKIGLAGFIRTTTTNGSSSRRQNSTPPTRPSSLF